MRKSLFPEKARWALDYKGIPHRCRDLRPGLHPVLLRARGRGTTVPVLDMSGRSVCGSSRIVAALEEVQPEPRLYPADTADRAEAVELEALFDEIGHDARRVTLDRVLREPDTMRRSLMAGRPWFELALTRGTHPVVERITRRRYRIDRQSVKRAHERVLAAFDEIESRLRPSGYLVGDSFTVADLAGAALLAVLLDPPEYHDSPWASASMPAELRALRDTLAGRPGGRWVLEMYRRHRGASGEMGRPVCR